MKNKSNFYFLVFIIILMLIIIYTTSNFRYLQAKFLPMAVAGCVILLSLIEFRNDARSSTVKSDTEGAVGSNPEDLRRYLIISGWLVAFLLIIYLSGFLVGMILFIISYLKAQGRTWLKALIMAFAVTAITYGLFSYFLGIELYRGVIFTY